MTFYLTCSQLFHRCAVLVNVQGRIGSVLITFALKYHTITAKRDLCVAAGTVKCMF